MESRYANVKETNFKNNKNTRNKQSFRKVPLHHFINKKAMHKNGKTRNGKYK